MSTDSWNDRRKSLEDSFFAERDQELLAKLRSHYAVQDQAGALAKVSGIKDAKLLDSLIAMGVTAGTFTALMLVPLVEVAWADGNVDEREKAAVLDAAAAHGVAPGTPPYQWLESMLKTRPAAGIIRSWKAYIHALVQELPPEAVALSKSQMIDWLTNVAQAAGGLLGFGNKTSTAEQACINDLARAYDSK